MLSLNFFTLELFASFSLLDRSIMEPLSALGVVTAAVQGFEFTARMMSTASKVRKAGNADLEDCRDTKRATESSTNNTFTLMAV